MEHRRQSGEGGFIDHGETGGSGGDATDITYTPAVLADWDGSADPGDVDDALDQLAERLTDVEAGGGVADADYGDITVSSSGTVWTIDNSVVTNAKLATAAKTGAIVLIVYGGGPTLTTGVKADIQIPFGATITAARLLADQSGSIVIDVWKDTYANYPPTDADSITASAPPTISSAIKSEDTTLSGWTTSISAGDILRFNIDSVTSITRVTLQLEFVKT